MHKLNLEIQHTNEWGVFRKTHPIDRPKGASDDEYSQHARLASELVARTLTGSPGDFLRVAGVVMMVVEKGLLSEEEIGEQLSSAAAKYSDNQTWQEVHVIKPALPVGA